MGVARETTSSPYGNDGSTDLQMVTLRETHTHTHTMPVQMVIQQVLWIILT